MRVVVMMIGIFINVTLAFIAQKLELPLFLDTIGTIVVSAITGCLWGLSTAVGTSIVCSVFNPTSIYYISVGVLVSLVSVAAVRRRKLYKKRYIVPFIIVLALIGGALGTGINWVLTGGPSYADVADIARYIAGDSEGLYGIMCVVLSVAADIVDKTICVAIAFLLYTVFPKKLREELWNSNWHQKPVSAEEIDTLDNSAKGTYTLGGRIFVLIMATGILLITAQSLITLKLYEDTVHDDYSSTVKKAAEFVAETVDGDRVDEYLKSFTTSATCNLTNYRSSYESMQKSMKAINGIKYMYVYQIKKDGVYLVFDVDPEEKDTMIGTRLEFDKSFLPYKDDLLAGKEIPVMESDDKYGHLLTAYAPIKDSEGRCVAYAGADVEYSSMEKYTKNYLSHSVLIIFGVFLFVVATALWITKFFMVRPLKAIAIAVDDFAVEEVEQKTLDQKVKDFREPFG